MNNIAVCLRGEVRNWDYTKDAVFKFFETIGYSVDYYYATWDVPYLDKKKLDSTFNNKKLIQGILCPTGNDRHRWGAKLGPAFLSSHIKLNKKYDLVVDTRFDSIPVFKESVPVIRMPGDNEIQTGFVNKRFFDHLINNIWEAGATNDRWAIMNQGTWDQFNYRLPLLYESFIARQNNKLYMTVLEMDYQRVLTNMNIKPTQCHWMNFELVRPSIIDLFPNSTSLTWRDHRMVHDNTFITWEALTNEEKIGYCQQQGIYCQDYQNPGNPPQQRHISV